MRISQYVILVKDKIKFSNILQKKISIYHYLKQHELEVFRAAQNLSFQMISREGVSLPMNLTLKEQKYITKTINEYKFI